MTEYCGRPDNFEDIIKAELSNVVTRDDILIHLGDICIGRDKEKNTWFGTLPCHKILVRGNHDKKSNRWYLVHGWDFVCEAFSDRLYDKNILFSHHPKNVDGYDLNIHGHFHNSLPRLLRGEFVVDGEEECNRQDLHRLTEDKHKLIALENTDYRPVDLEKLLTKL